MKIKYLQYSIIVISFIFVFLSCQNLSDEKNEEIITQKAPVLSFAVSSKSNNAISFKTKASWYNGCGRFSHFTSTKTDSTFYITVFGTQSKNAICTQAFIEFDAPVTVSISGRGNYTFKFWQTDSTSIDTTIIF